MTLENIMIETSTDTARSVFLFLSRSMNCEVIITEEIPFHVGCDYSYYLQPLPLVCLLRGIQQKSRVFTTRCRG